MRLYLASTSPARLAVLRAAGIEPVCFSPEVEDALQTIANTIAGSCAPDLLRWYSIKVFERDSAAIESLGLSKQQLASMDHEDDDPGTSWNERARAAKPDWMSPRMAWRAIQSALPKEAIISSMSSVICIF